MKKTQYEDVNAAPVKSFFVSMLTRDIKLEDAILDLLDNCVDGILRSKSQTKGKKPYDGFYAEIDFNKDSFTMSDNCGGIPWSLHTYAFRMGRADARPKDAPGTVGVYGIGMKRAIFKIGKECLISTQNKDNRYDVEITEKWISDEGDWMIPVKAAKKEKNPDGTTIYITNLYPGIKSRFGSDAKSFSSELDRMISTHYAFIIDKGFKVKINGTTVKPKPTKLMFSTDSKLIRPFIFKSTIGDVDVFLTVGFTRPIPSQDEVFNEQERKRHSSLEAGWTVICNDRAVLYCDKTELTGWGEAGVAQYHTQFIAIAGIVEFQSKDPSKLPTTTTKRGIDASSTLYLQVKNKMRDGMRLFIDYTNKWKGQAEESKKHMAAGGALSFDEIKKASQQLSFSSVTKSGPSGKQYKPSLPEPKREEPQTRKISFSKKIKDIERVSEHLFEDKSTNPSVVGEKCFDLILKETR